jgi:hypothetical protein
VEGAQLRDKKLRVCWVRLALVLGERRLDSLDVVLVVVVLPVVEDEALSMEGHEEAARRERVPVRDMVHECRQRGAVLSRPPQRLRNERRDRVGCEPAVELDPCRARLAAEDRARALHRLVLAPHRDEDDHPALRVRERVHHVQQRRVGLVQVVEEEREQTRLRQDREDVDDDGLKPRPQLVRGQRLVRRVHLDVEQPEDVLELRGALISARCQRRARGEPRELTVAECSASVVQARCGGSRQSDAGPS